MIKRYSSPAQRFTVNVKKNGKPHAVVFDNYSPDQKRRYIDIKDPELQDQMEKSPDFRVYFRLDQVINDEQVTPQSSEIEAPESFAPVRKEFKSGVEARTWLNTEHGVSNSKLTNNQKIINEAAQLGFMITILNMKQ